MFPLPVLTEGHHELGSSWNVFFNALCGSSGTKTVIADRDEGNENSDFETCWKGAKYKLNGLSSL